MGGVHMQFSVTRPDVVRAINQRWLLKYWQRHLQGHRVPRWQSIEAEDIARLSDGLSFLDVISGDGGLRFQIRFHGPVIGQVFGAADCRGKFLYDSTPEPTRTHKLAPYQQTVDSGRPVYTIHDVTDRGGRLVHYERLLLPFSRDGETVDRILTSFEFVCEDGAFTIHELMTTPAEPPALRLSATIAPPD
jgi:hypothetical protein